MSITNPVSALPSDISVTALQNGLFVTYTEPSDSDWIGSIVALSTTNPPNTTSERVFKGPGNAHSLAKDSAGDVLLPNTVYYVKVAVYDAFGETGITWSDVYTITTLQVVEADIATDAVTTNKIEDLAVTDAKLDSITANKITAGTITGSTLQTSSQGSRIVVADTTNDLRLYGRLDTPAAGFVVFSGTKYEVMSVASADWSSFGGPVSASVGDVFIATSNQIPSSAYGSVGTLTYYEETAVTLGDEYKISTVTASDWSALGGPSSAALGDTFIATTSNSDITSYGEVLNFSVLSATLSESDRILDLGSDENCSVTSIRARIEADANKASAPAVRIDVSGSGGNVHGLYIVSSAGGQCVSATKTGTTGSAIHGRVDTANTNSSSCAIDGLNESAYGGAILGTASYVGATADPFGVKGESYEGHGVVGITHASTGVAGVHAIGNGSSTWALMTSGGPMQTVSYTVATVPSAGSFSAGLIYVSDETGGAVLAFSDGTDWRRVTDRAIVS